MACGIGIPLVMSFTVLIVSAMSIPILGNVVLSIFGVVAVLAITWAYVGSLIWVFSDAKLRGKSSPNVTAMVALFVWPVGLLLWIFFRPQLNADHPAVLYSHDRVKT